MLSVSLPHHKNRNLIFGKFGAITAWRKWSLEEISKNDHCEIGESEVPDELFVSWCESH